MLWLCSLGNKFQDDAVPCTAQKSREAGDIYVTPCDTQAQEDVTNQTTQMGISVLNPVSYVCRYDVFIIKYFSELCQSVSPQHVRVAGMLSFQVQVLLFFMRFLLAPSSSLPGSLWMAALPSSVFTVLPNLKSSANLTRVHPVTTSRSLIKILNLKGPRADPCGIHLSQATHQPPLSDPAHPTSFLPCGCPAIQTVTV